MEKIDQIFKELGKMGVLNKGVTAKMNELPSWIAVTSDNNEIHSFLREVADEHGIVQMGGPYVQCYLMNRELEMDVSMRYQGVHFNPVPEGKIQQIDDIVHTINFLIKKNKDVSRAAEQLYREARG